MNHLFTSKEMLGVDGVYKAASNIESLGLVYKAVEEVEL